MTKLEQAMKALEKFARGPSPEAMQLYILRGLCPADTSDCPASSIGHCETCWNQEVVQDD